MTSDHPLKKYREKHGITLDALGAMLGVSGQTVWRWENGRREPRKGVRRQIEQKLGIKAAAIIGFDASERVA